MELPVVYEIDEQPAVPDLAVAAAAMVCRMSYTAVRTAVDEHQAGERHATGTLAHSAIIAWRAAQQMAELLPVDGSHSASSARASTVPDQIRESNL